MLSISSIQRAILLLFLIFSTFLCSGVSFAEEPELLAGADYAPRLLDTLRHAQKTIDVALYRMESDAPEPRRLIDELVAAKRRGVEVRVYLDREGDQGGYNAPAAGLLHEAGIPVFWDDPKRMFHLKAVVVDAEEVVIGSHNWTRAGLTQNAELSSHFRSRESAGRIRAYLSGLSWTPGPILSEEPETVLLESAFLKDKSRFGRMARMSSDDGLDLYLWLRTFFIPGEPFLLDYETAASAMGHASRMSRPRYRGFLNGQLRKLEKRYGLLQFQPKYGKEARVVLQKISDAEGLFPFPKDYWRFRWREELSFPAKVCFLIVLHEQALGPKEAAGFWSRSQAQLGALFGLGHNTLSAGMTELARKKLVDLRYRRVGTSDGVMHYRGRYRLRRLYDPAALRDRFAELEQRYGLQRVNQARRWAAAVLRENDPTAVGLLLKETDAAHRKDAQEKRAKMDLAARRVGAKRPFNPKRRFGYLVGTYRGLLRQ